MSQSGAFSSCILVSLLHFLISDSLILAELWKELSNVKDISENIADNDRTDDDNMMRKCVYICPCILTTARKVFKNYKKIHSSYNIEIHHGTDKVTGWFISQMKIETWLCFVGNEHKLDYYQYYIVMRIEILDSHHDFIIRTAATIYFSLIEFKLIF